MTPTIKRILIASILVVACLTSILWMCSAIAGCIEHFFPSSDPVPVAESLDKVFSPRQPGAATPVVPGCFNELRKEQK